MPDSTEATAAGSSGVTEAITEESSSVTTRNVRKTQKGKLSAGAGSISRIPRELARLIQPDQFSRLVSTSGANLTPAAVGSIAGQTRGRMASRNPPAEGQRFLSAEGRRGGRSLSAEARRSRGLSDVTTPTTKGNMVGAKGIASPRSNIASSRSQVAPATASEGDLTAENAEKKIEERLNEKMAMHAARLREQQHAARLREQQQAAQDEEDRARRLE